jgi:hypothetical protein
MGSSSLNADVNALERLQIVLGRNSSYFDFGGHIREFASLPGLHLLAHGLEVSLHPVNAH